MKVKVGNNKAILEWIVVIILVFTSMTIYFRLPLIPLFNIVLLLVILGAFRSDNKKSIVAFVLFLVVFLRTSLFPSANINEVILTSYLNSILYSIILAALFLIKRDIYISLVRKLTVLLAILFAFGIVFHVLKITGAFSFEPITTYYGDRELAVWDVYFWGNYKHMAELRFHSIFDEPGYLGTISAFLLALNRYDFEKKENIIIFIAGLLTLSLAFYFLSILYFVLLFAGERRSLIRIAVVTGLALAVAFLVFPVLWDLILQSVIGRIYETDELAYGEIRGIQASKESWKYLKSQELPSFLWGNGMDSHITADVRYIRSSAWGRLVYQIGFLFSLYFIFLVFSYAIHDKYRLFFGIVFLLSIYQRPQIFSALFMFFLAAGLLGRDNNHYLTQKTLSLD